MTLKLDTYIDIWKGSISTSVDQVTAWWHLNGHITCTNAISDLSLEFGIASPK